MDVEALDLFLFMMRLMERSLNLILIVFIEFVRSNYIASHCEFVDASGQDYIFCVDSAIATFENCSFLNIYNKPIWQIGTNEYHYVNCITNENYPDMTNTEYNQPYHIETFSYQKVECNNIHCSYSYYRNPICYEFMLGFFVSM